MRALLLLFLLVSNIAFTQKLWTGNTDTDWETAGNWSGGLPVTGDDIVIDPTNYTGAAANPTISINSTFNPLTVIVQNGGVLTIQADLTTTGDVTIDAASAVVNMTVASTFTAGAKVNITTGASFTLSGALSTFTATDDFKVDGDDSSNPTVTIVWLPVPLKVTVLKPSLNVPPLLVQSPATLMLAAS